jgi:hypothetical protein
MNEEDFWVQLERRICDELSGMDDRSLRALWCDGLVPRQYLLNDEVPRITGYAWIVTGTSSDAQWDLELFLPRSPPSQDAMEWASLIPPDGATEWLEIDQQLKITDSSNIRRRRTAVSLDTHGAVLLLMKSLLRPRPAHVSSSSPNRFSIGSPGSAELSFHGFGLCVTSRTRGTLRVP